MTLSRFVSFNIQLNLPLNNTIITDHKESSGVVSLINDQAKVIFPLK